MDELEARFEAALRENYEEAKQYGLVGTRFIQMVNQNGAMNTALHLLSPDRDHLNIPKGLIRLQKEDALHLSLEATVLRPEFEALFKDEVRKIARMRLDQVRNEFV